MLSRVTRIMAALLFFGCVVSLEAAETFTLDDPGTDEIIDYAKYGEFEGVGTENYKYRIKKHAELRNAAGEGVFPNTASVYKDPQYKQMKKEGKLEGSHWNFVNTDDHQANFYKWATAAEEPGVKLYYTAMMLEKSGNFKQAIKAYHAIVVNFPKSTGSTFWGSPWYIAPVSIDKINYITRQHPELGMKLVGASVKVKNKFEDDRNNDVFIVTPGQIVKAKPKDVTKIDRVNLKKLKIVKTVGGDKVRLVQYSNKHWQLLVDGKPYVVKGMAYSPNKVGLSPDTGTLDVSRDWMFADFNNNGKIDGPHEAFVDKNHNDKQDKDEPAVGDFQLMKDMGVNTLRLYHHAAFNKDLLREGYEKYGFRYLMGDFIGMYAVGSKADWFSGTDYTNPQHRENMLASVRQMVEDYKDEPYILMWILGNENNYGVPGKEGVTSGEGCRARLQPEAYYQFVNEAAKLIKSLDPQKRPVAICNGDVLFLDKCAANAPDIDVFGANAYRGEQGFGSLWEDVSEVYDKPVIVTEYGCSAYHKLWDRERAEAGQAKYHRGNWMNIQYNMAGTGAGNALGGIVFEFTDEWWKAGPPPNYDAAKHETIGKFGAPFLDGWSYEEWLGLAGQGDGKNSPFLRQLRPSYFEYKKMWEKL